MIPSSLDTHKPMRSKASQRFFQFGKHQFRFGKEVVELRDSSDALANTRELQRRLRSEGYLFIRGFHPRAHALAATNWTLQAISERGGLKPETPIQEGLVALPARNFPFFRVIEVSHGEPILNLVNSDTTFAFFERLFEKPVLTFDKRWLRCMATGGQNHFHYDNVYVGRGTKNRLTMWTALTDTPLDQGPLVLCLGSHKHERLKATYGQTDMDRDLTEAVFSENPRELVDDFGFTLGTSHYSPGDVVIFGMFMMHSSAPNQSDKYRISIDTRYQPANEAKDERFFGENGKWQGNFYNQGAVYQSMRELRSQWKL